MKLFFPIKPTSPRFIREAIKNYRFNKFPSPVVNLKYFRLGIRAQRKT
jgi:hypothetical protein